MNSIEFFLALITNMISADAKALAQKTAMWGVFRAVGQLVRLHLASAVAPIVGQEQAHDEAVCFNRRLAYECLALLPRTLTVWERGADGKSVSRSVDKVEWLLDSLDNSWQFWMLGVNTRQDDENSQAVKTMLDKIRAMEASHGLASSVSAIEREQLAKAAARVIVHRPFEADVKKAVLRDLKTAGPGSELTEAGHEAFVSAVERKLSDYAQGAARGVSFGNSVRKAESLIDAHALIEARAAVHEELRRCVEAQRQGQAVITGELDAEDEAEALDIEAAYARRLGNA